MSCDSVRCNPDIWTSFLVYMESVLVVLSVGRFVILPVVCQSLFFGPNFMIFPWPIWGLLYYSRHWRYLTIRASCLEDSPDSSAPSEEESGVENDIELTLTQNANFEVTGAAFAEEVALTINDGREEGEDGKSDAEPSGERAHQSLSLTDAGSDTSSVEAVASEENLENRHVWIFSAFDVLDAVGCVICIILCYFFIYTLFVEPDGQVDRAYPVENAWVWVALVLYYMQLAFYVLKLFVSVVSCFPCCELGSNSLFTKGPLLTRRKTQALLVWSAVGAVAAGCFGFVMLNTYMEGHVYTSVKDADYADCDAMVPETCLLPYPSMQYLLRDNATTTGYRVNVQSETLPFARTGRHLEANFLSSFDGFPVGTMVLFQLPGLNEAIEPLLAGPDDVAETLAFNSSTLILDMDTGLLHPHFAELDYMEEYVEGPRLAYLMPAKRLQNDRHYAVVVQNTTLAATPLISEYVAAYRSGAPGAALLADLRYIRFRDHVFPLLESRAVDLLKVQLVFDFHTASVGANSDVPKDTEFLSTMVDNALAQLESQKNASGMGSLYSLVSSSSEYLGESKLRELHHFKIQVPWYLENQKYVGNRMDIPQVVADIAVNRSFPLNEVGLTILVPQSVIEGRLGVQAIVECGHGLFLNRGSIDISPMRRLANDNGFVVFAMDLRGLNLGGLPVLGKISTTDASTHIVDLYKNLVQGYVNKIVGSRFFIKELLALEKGRLKLPANFNAASVPSVYYSYSLGSILGVGYLGYSGHSRAVMLIGGSSISFILARSSLFGFFRYLLRLQFFDDKDIRMVTTIAQMIFDFAENPRTFTTSGTEGGVKVMLQIALGDATVSPIGGQIMARNLNATLLTPSVVSSVPDLSSTSTADINLASNQHQNVLVLAAFQDNYAKIPSNSAIPPSNNAHGCLPRSNVLLGQAANFIVTGNVSDVGVLDLESCAN